MIFHTASDYERMKAETYFNRLVTQKKDIEVKEKKRSDHYCPLKMDKVKN